MDTFEGILLGVAAAMLVILFALVGALIALTVSVIR